ncbi:hypothetical protein [Tenacibaculum soleae]|uniref:hypothetical protein n=1 Tax=Tenacibaculum soleae TaxID=447689 RepID=UPI0022FFE1E6|nr:hypothetical protein [Tenacibaculum soleae]
MSRRTRVKIDNNVDARYITWVDMMIDMIEPKNLFFIGARGVGKTSSIVAKRSQKINESIPGAYFAFLSDTYVNALDNIVPSLIEGWKRQGYKEHIDYVVDQPPPSHFKLPYKQPEAYKHTISTRFGNFYKLVSMDVPTSAAGNSYQHVFIDEARNIDFAKAKKLTPALRGYPAFGHSVYYRGFTATTDIPNIADGDYDWILAREKDMDQQQIKDVLNAAITLNEIKLELYNAYRDKDFNKVRNIQRNYQRWLIRWTQARKNSTLFYQVSTFANADILTPGYFKDQLDALGIEEFKSAICTLKPTLKKGEKFYTTLGNHHFFDDGIIPGYYDNYKIGDTVDATSLALKYIQHDKPLSVGVDFGNMCSMIIGQEQGNYVYLLKELFTLAPEHTKELALKFTDFFKYHKFKVLDIWYDRSGNQNAAIKKDYATELKNFLEEKGWKVNLMNKNQATIFQEEEFNHMKHFFGGYKNDLPQIKIDKFNCRNYKSSIELAKTKLSKHRKTGSTIIQKDKSSEKLPLHQLPMHSTNFSDAGKYFFFRPKWVKQTRQRGVLNFSAPTIG